MKNNEPRSLRFLGCAFLVVTTLSFQGCKSSDSGIKTDAATSSGTDAGSCPGAAFYCCRFSGGTEDTLVATCTGGKWTCPEGRYLTQTAETSCCLPDGGTTPPVCDYGQVECRSGSSPCGGSVTDGGTCAGDRYCCPTFGSAAPFPAPYCLGGWWVCPRSAGVPAAGTPGVCCFPDGGTARTECVGDMIQCSPLLGGTLCDRAGVGQD
jgi:hypothetical protein